MMRFSYFVPLIKNSKGPEISLYKISHLKADVRTVVGDEKFIPALLCSFPNDDRLAHFPDDARRRRIANVIDKVFQIDQLPRSRPALPSDIAQFPAALIESAARRGIHQ